VPFVYLSLTGVSSSRDSILCTNRDEYLSRPTIDAEFHKFGREAERVDPGQGNDRNVLSGRDSLAGGTWLGINRAGRVALL
jgi:uncharacterized protein with NRDE domain